MEKAIILGIGKRYEDYRQFLEEKYEIVGYIDNNPRNGAYHVEHIFDFNFDKVIVTPLCFMEMIQQLHELGVDPCKIIALDTLCGANERKSLGLGCYGQHFDDLIISGIFGQIGIKQPSYLDLGSNDPIIGSNTYLLYKNGCKGVCIDANPLTIKKFLFLRPADISIAVGVSDSEGILPFYCFDDYSGLNTFSKEEADKFSKSLHLKIQKIIDIPVITLSTIIEKYCNNIFPNFLDCDIEGFDYKVLNSYNLKDNGPKVACVEVRINEINKFDELFDRYGYFRHCRMGGNNIYVRKEYSQQLIHMVL